MRLSLNNPEDRKLLEKIGQLQPQLEHERKISEGYITEVSKNVSERQDKREKYGNKRVYYKNECFQSQLELDHWLTLLDIQHQGKIKDLKRQIPIVFEHNGTKIWKCILDFEFTVVKTGKSYYGDSKQEFTTKNRIWRTTVKMVRAFHDREIVLFYSETNVQKTVYNLV